MKPSQLISKIAEQNKIPEGDVQEVYDSKLEECEEAGLKGNQAKERAMKRTWGAFKRQSMSSSTGVEGIILGAGDRYDAVNYSRENAIEAYQSNPVRAISDGKVAVAVPPNETGNLTGSGVEVVGEKAGWAIVSRPDNDNILGYDFAERDTAESDDANTQVEEGWRVYPLDTRESYGNGDPNPRFGTPTPKHQWKRRGLGLFRTGDSDVKVGNLTLTGKKSMQNPPLGKAVQFKARVNEGDDGELYINSTSDTEFTPAPDLDDNLSSIDSLIERHFDDYLQDLEGAYSFMADKGGSRTLIITGDVIDMNLEATSNGTFRMVIGQLSFAGGEMKEQEATVWVPEWHDQYIDFAVESRVYVVGRARMQDAYDTESGGRTSEEQELVINAQGLYADPTSKVPREDSAEDLDEDDFDFDPEDEDTEEAEVEPSFDGGEEW